MFSNYTRTNFDLFDHTDAGSTYTYALDGMLGMTYGTMGANHETGSVDIYDFSGGSGIQDDLETDPKEQEKASDPPELARKFSSVL